LLRTADGTAAAPQVFVYNLAGARVAKLEARHAQNGTWRSEWLPEELRLVSGVYFLQATFGRERINRKILFIRQ